MRKLYSFSIVLAQFLFCAANAKNTATVHQARGLKKNKCYSEAVALTCDKQCTITLFAQTRKQLVVKVTQMPEKARSALGYFFTTEFRVLNEAGTEVALLSWAPISSKVMRRQHTQAAGLLVGHVCNKQI